jgi:hypothetical protein
LRILLNGIDFENTKQSTIPHIYFKDYERKISNTLKTTVHHGNHRQETNYNIIKTKESNRLKTLMNFGELIASVWDKGEGWKRLREIDQWLSTIIEINEDDENSELT